MYDLPGLGDHTDALWSEIRDQLRARGLPAPDSLTRTADPWLDWTAPDLVLSQTCSLPFRAHLSDRVTIVGTPDYGLPDSPPGH